MRFCGSKGKAGNGSCKGCIYVCVRGWKGTRGMWWPGEGRPCWLLPLLLPANGRNYVHSSRTGVIFNTMSHSPRAHSHWQQLQKDKQGNRNKPMQSAPTTVAKYYSKMLSDYPPVCLIKFCAPLPLMMMVFWVLETLYLSQHFSFSIDSTYDK